MTWKELSAGIRHYISMTHAAAQDGLAMGPRAVVATNKQIEELLVIKAELGRQHYRCDALLKQLQSDPRLVHNQIAASVAAMSEKR